MDSRTAFKKILVIDDDELFLKPLIKYLTMMKYQVNKANRGDHGLDLHKTLQFDLIITDLRMEGINGLEVIKLINENHPGTKIIVISGFVNEDEFGEIRDNKSVVGIFQKPVDYNTLNEKIREVV